MKPRRRLSLDLEVFFLPTRLDPMQAAAWPRRQGTISPSVEIMQAKAAIQTFICFVAILLQFRDSSWGLRTGQ